MGADVLYGSQKEWFYGGTFDGMLKADSGITDFKWGSNNDFLFPQDKQVASRLNAGATATVVSTVKYFPNAISIGHATAFDIRKIGGVSPLYDGSRYFIYGLPTPTLLKQPFGAQGFWYYGGTDADIFPTTQAGIAIAGASASVVSTVKYFPKAIAIGQATATDIRKIGGAVDTQGNQKYWAVGQAMGFTFFALGNTVNTTNKSKFADQTLWYFGLPTPDLVGTVPAVVVTNSPAKSVSPQMETKRQVAGWPVSVKIISAAIPNKRSSTL